MSARAVIETVLGLSIVLSTSGSIKAQEPKATEAAKVTASKSVAGQETPAQAVARTPSLRAAQATSRPAQGG